jgi:hypothetical protein
MKVFHILGWASRQPRERGSRASGSADIAATSSSASARFASTRLRASDSTSAAAAAGLDRRRLAIFSNVRSLKKIRRRVVDQFARLIAPENVADADHAERRAFGRAQRAQTARAEHRDAVFDREQNLLVPRRRDILVASVDQTYHIGVGFHGAGDVALRGRRQTTDARRERQTAVLNQIMQRGSDEQNLHCRPSRKRSARGP